MSYVCFTRSLTVGCPTGIPDCEPITTYQQVCEWKSTGNPPKGINPTGDPNGDGGGGNGDMGFEYPEPPEETEAEAPCEKANTNNTQAKVLFDNISIKNKKDSLTTTIATDTNEKSFSFGKDSNGDYKTTDITISTTGNSVGIKATSNTMTIEGGAHTHTSDLYNCFSAGDFYAFQGANTANSNFEYYYVFAADGTAYVLTITNPDDFADFLANYPKGTHFDTSTAGWQANSPIGIYFEQARKQFLNSVKSQDEAYEKATAMVTAKFKTGMSLSKMDSTGNFKSIFVKENTNYISVNGVPLPITSYETTADCNLK